MGHPILLICDDIALVAMVRGLLEREGRESVLATSVADALIAYGHYAPRVILLDPSVEGGRGRTVLEELSKHPASRPGRVLLLGGEVDGWQAPVVPLPIDGDTFVRLLASIDAAEGDKPPAAAGADSSSDAPSWWQPVPTPGEPTQTAPAVWRLALKRRARQEVSVPRTGPGQQIDGGPEGAVARSFDGSMTDPEPIGLVSPETAVLPAAPSGRLAIEQLADLVMRLCNSSASVCLELTSSEATRTIWLKDGRLIAAASSLYEESLLSRARADGLLDREQEKELRQLPSGSPAEVVRAMRTSGYLREVEVVPLVQRNAEQIALEAFSQEESAYRLGTDGLDSRAIAAPSPTPALQLLPRALERTMSEESILASFGGLDAVPVPRRRVSALRDLGLTEAELEMLGAVDGASTVGELLLGCAMPQEQALKALQLARLLSAIEIRPGTKPSAAPGPDVDVRRLRSKFEDIQEADYFAVLGLPRSAGSEEVRQAFQVLSAEFDPLKFAGHRDPSLQSQAEQIQDVLAEAARTLQDDRLRAAYAGNLID
jgi:CheY-like chemotaxis protein